MAKTQQSGGAEHAAAELAQTSTKSLAENIELLQDMGGFKLLETTIQGAGNLNPERPARKDIFLQDDSRKTERESLKQRLRLWQELLSKSTSDLDKSNPEVEKPDKYLDKLAKEVVGRQAFLEGKFNHNLQNVIKATRDFESTYRGIDLFFENGANSGLPIRNAVFVNASIDQLETKSLDNKETIAHIQKEIHHQYNQLDLANSYSLIVIPGFLKNATSIKAWAKFVHDNKLMLVTDYRNMNKLDDLLDVFREEGLAVDDQRYANVIMACNYLIGRGKYDDLKEKEDLYVAPSAALAGKMYKNVLSQVAAGFEKGSLDQVDGVRIDLLKTETGLLEQEGLVPITDGFGAFFPFSGKTLYTGNNIGLKTYSVVRVFDWIMKVLMHFLNKRAFTNWSWQVEDQIQIEIVEFLNKIKGPGKIIEKFDIPQFKVDPNQKDRIFLDLHITPYFPAKTFVINLSGEDGKDPDAKDRRISDLNFKGSMK